MYCSSSSQKLGPTFQEYLMDIPGTIDTTADNTLRDSLFGAQPQAMEQTSLTVSDLDLTFTLDDPPVDASQFNIEEVADEDFEKTVQASDPAISSSKGNKFIIRLPSFGTKPAPKASSSTGTSTATADTKKRKSSGEAVATEQESTQKVKSKKKHK